MSSTNFAFTDKVMMSTEHLLIFQFVKTRHAALTKPNIFKHLHSFKQAVGLMMLAM